MNSTLKTLTLIASGSMAAMVLATAPKANAVVLTLMQTESIPFTTTNWNTNSPPPSPLEFDLFDPSLGELLSVEIKATARAQGFYNVENDSTTATTQYGTAVFGGNDEVGALVGVTGPASVVLQPNPVDNVGGGTLAVSDGTAGSGPDFFGFIIDPANAIDQQIITLTDAASLLAYSGLGTFSFNAQSASDITVSVSGGNPQASNQVDSDVQIMVTYTYEQDNNPQPVPEPGTIVGLLGVGAAGLVSRRRNHSK